MVSRWRFPVKLSWQSGGPRIHLYAFDVFGEAGLEALFIAIELGAILH